jgi:hypothetical protein
MHAHTRTHKQIKTCGASSCSRCPWVGALCSGHHNSLVKERTVVLTEIEPFVAVQVYAFCALLALCIAMGITLWLLLKPRPVLLLDFYCFRPPDRMEVKHRHMSEGIRLCGVGILLPIGCIYMPNQASPPHGNVGDLPHGNVGDFSHGNVGDFSHGNVGASLHGNVGASPHGNVGAFLHGNVGASLHGNVGVCLHGNVGAPLHGKVGSSLHEKVGASLHGKVGGSLHGK